MTRGAAERPPSILQAELQSLFRMKVEEGTLLWTPSASRVARSHLTRYLRWLAERGRTFDDYEALWRWSVADLETFWAR